ADNCSWDYSRRRSYRVLAANIRLCPYFPNQECSRALTGVFIFGTHPQTGARGSRRHYNLLRRGGEQECQSIIRDESFPGRSPLLVKSQEVGMGKLTAEQKVREYN